jgi:phosphoglycerate dehydrogenase-like enzyme
MSTHPGFPDRARLRILFAHAAYRLGERFAQRETGIEWIELRTAEALLQRIGEADVLVISGLWRNELIERAPRLRFIQSISAGVDQYAREKLNERGIRLASAQGVNAGAVAEHAVALMLALSRQLHVARDNQARRTWRGMISDPALREDELEGKTLLIVGLGRIGARLAALARAFGMRVVATRRRPTGSEDVDLVLPGERLRELLPQADVIALTCPLASDTDGLIDADALAAMKRSAVLINVSRGRVVDEAALVAALRGGEIAGAALDCFREEPLPATSALWSIENVLLTPHTAGETRRYEDNVIDILMENLDRLWGGETALKNDVV